MVDSREGRASARRCGVAAILLTVGTSACGSGSDAGTPASVNSCAEPEPGATVTFDADVQVLAVGQSWEPKSGMLAPMLLTDADSVYWYDGDGSVFAEHQDEDRPVELTHAEPPESQLVQAVLGIAQNEDQLFVGNGSRSESVDFVGWEYSPPGRLLSISKQDGKLKELLHEDRWIAPIVADAERVIVYAGNEQGSGIYQVRFADPQLEPLPLGAPLQSSQLVGDQVYWLSAERPVQLLRSGFDEAKPEALMQMPDDAFFAVGPGYVVSKKDRVLPGYFYAGKEFVLLDGSGCRFVSGQDTAPGLVAPTVTVDSRFLYWVQFDASASASEPGPVHLMRADVESGALTRMNVPGVTPGLDLIVGQDATRIFLRSQGTLVAVQKL
jgi:hypothetical protein